MGASYSLVTENYRPFLGVSQPPAPSQGTARCCVFLPQGDLGPRRGRACRRLYDDSELGEPVTTHQPVPVQQGSGGRVTYILLYAPRKQVRRRLL